MRSVTAFRPCWESRDLGFRILDVGFEELAVERFAQNSSSEISISNILDVAHRSHRRRTACRPECPTRFFGRKLRKLTSSRSKSSTTKSKHFLRYDGDAALAQARAIDERRAKNQPVGLLAGLPVAVKDLICTQRRTDDLRLEDPGKLPPAVRCDGHRETAGRRCRVHRPDEHGRVRDGRLDRELRVLPPRAIPGTWPAFPAAPAAGRRPAWRRAWPAFRSAPTPAARSASRPACAA